MQTNKQQGPHHQQQAPPQLPPQIQALARTALALHHRPSAQQLYNAGQPIPLGPQLLPALALPPPPQPSVTIIPSTIPMHQPLPAGQQQLPGGATLIGLPKVSSPGLLASSPAFSGHVSITCTVLS
jgi:hypothetical protein